MKRVRVIPLLLLYEQRAVITRKFGKPTYVGDPINTVKLFNEKEVDELIILDITPKSSHSTPNYELISKLASESFMPVVYGGGIVTMDQAERIINCGVEKISFNTALFEKPDLITSIANRFGSQSVVASVDVKKNLFAKYFVKTTQGTKPQKIDITKACERIGQLGVGEVLLTSIDRDGQRSGYDLFVIRTFRQLLSIPIIACGGAANLNDFTKAIEAGASAVAAGAMFYFKGDMNAVLINYPDQISLANELYSKI